MRPIIKKYLNESHSDYLKWKRKNVTLRGIREFGNTNKIYSSFGDGLYTAFLGNKSLARKYGKVYFVVNAKPKKPKVVQSYNSAEIFIQNIIVKFSEKHNREEYYDRKFFEEKTSIKDEMLNLGYDGLIIQGGEMVNYTPEDVKYFETENQLIHYYETFVEG